MTTAIIGTGGLGSVIARLLVIGGEPVRLASADTASARAPAAQIGPSAVAATDNRDSWRAQAPSCWHCASRLSNP